MNVNIQKLKNFTKRFTPVLTALVVLVCCISFSASAEALDYRDYEVSVTVDGNNDIVTLGFPYEDWADWTLRPFSGGIEIATGKGAYFWDEFSWMDNYEKFYLAIAPFGGSTFANRVNPYDGMYLSTENIPSDAKWVAKLFVRMDDEANTLTPVHFTYRSWAVDGKNAYIVDSGVSSSLDTVDDGDYLATFSGDVSSEGNGWFPQFLFHFSADSSVLAYGLSSFEVTMSINSYYRVLEDMGYTEQIDELRQELEQQNIKLDSIINGTPEQNEQADQFRDEMDSAIGDLNNAGDVMSDVPKPEINVDDLVPSDILAGSDFLTYTATIGEFWNSDILSSFTTVLGGLLLLSYVLFGEKG